MLSKHWLCAAALFIGVSHAADDAPTPTDWVVALSLVFLSAMFAGLTIGIMGLDTLSLEIIAESGDEPEKTHAARLLPVRRLGHQALCTLVLGNMAANVMISQFGAKVVPSEGGGGGGGIAGFLGSTAVILVFTEILPMSICKSSRALAIAASSVPILKLFIVLLYPVAKPLGMLLDRIIPHSVGQIYDRNELRRLMTVHAEKYEQSGLQGSELTMMMGALDIIERTAGATMRPLSKATLVGVDTPLRRPFVVELWKRGFSRIPVVAGSGIVPIAAEDDVTVVGILFVKDLLEFAPFPGEAGPGEKTSGEVATVARVIDRDVRFVDVSTPLKDVVRASQGGSHLVVVADAGRHVGILSFEDVVEVLLRTDIFDEFDAGTRERQWTAPRVDMWSLGVTPPNVLTFDQAHAVAWYMVENVAVFALVDVARLVRAILQWGAATIPPSTLSDDGRYTRDHETFAKAVRPDALLLQRGRPAECFTLVLAGEVEVLAGTPCFHSVHGILSAFGAELLERGGYVPAVSARVARGGATVLRVSLENFRTVAAPLDPTPPTTPDVPREEERSRDVHESLT